MKLKDSKKEMQQKYVELQMIDAQIKQIEKQLQAIEAQSVEIEAILFSLDELSKTEVGAEILVPVSSGIFVKASLKDNKQLRVNVGGNTVVEKDIPATKALLVNQVSEMRRLQEELTEQYEKLAGAAEKLTIDINALAGEQQ